MLHVQQHSRCHSVSFVIYISGAKFEENCFDISGDILDSVFIVYVELFFTHHFPHLHNTKSRISLKLKKRFQKGHSSLLRKAFQLSSNYIFTSLALKQVVGF